VIYISEKNNPGNEMVVTKQRNGFVQSIVNIIERYLPLDQFIKFCFVGGMGTLLNLFILYTSVEFLNLWYIYGAAIAFVVVITFNFTLNKFWTFKDKKKESNVVVGQYGKYVVIGGVGMGINIFSLFILVEFFHIWYLMGEIIAIVIATLWNFEGSRYIVFGIRKNKYNNSNQRTDSQKEE
jgi:putative flippase GtrA